MNKPFYKRWVFWVIVIVVGGTIGLLTGNDDPADQAAPAATEEAQPVAAAPTIEPTAKPTTAPTEQPEASPTTEPAKEASSEPATTIDADQVPLKEQEVLDYTINLTGKTFIKKVNVGTDSIAVDFFKDFKEYKEENPASAITEAEYKDYFSTGDQINQILMEETTRLFKQFPGAATVDMTIPFEGKSYSVSLTKGQIEEFYKIDFSTLTSDDEWRGLIANPFFDDENRKKFVNEFVSIK